MPLDALREILLPLRVLAVSEPYKQLESKPVSHMMIHIVSVVCVLPEMGDLHI